jgi:ABC-type transport system involved in multi-copper enzyme maturation permease subunit
MLTLYREELRALMRGRFAWLGAAVVLLGLGGLSAVATQDSWLDGYGVVAYFLAPVCFLPLSAGTIASPRATRFVESVFTAPVDRGQWFSAKVLVLLTVALAYYVAVAPLAAVYVANVGMPFLLARYLLWTPGILVACIAIGTLVGVMFIGRSVAPPVATGVGLMLVYAVLTPLQELLVTRGFGSTAMGHVTLVSPLVLLKNGLGFTLATSAIPETTVKTWICLTLVVAGSFALAAWNFLRAQGVESWEASSRQRWIIAFGILSIAVVPVAFADTNYEKEAPAQNGAPSIPGLFLRGGGQLALVEPGAPLPAACCDTLLNRDKWPSLPTGQTTRQDLLLFLPVDVSQRLLQLDVRVVGQNGLQIQASPVSADLLHSLETRAYAQGIGPADADGRRIQKGWVARIPVDLTPAAPWDIGGIRYPIDLDATFSVEGVSRPNTLNARAAVEAHVPNALAEMAIVGAMLPLACAAAMFNRWRRTR